ARVSRWITSTTAGGSTASCRWGGSSPPATGPRPTSRRRFARRFADLERSAAIMNVGISVPLPAYHVDVGFMARKAEELGFESFWCAEHPFLPVKPASPL